MHSSLQRGRRWLSERHLSRRARALLADPRTHEFLWYCVPGILVAFLWRAWLMMSLPYGYYHPDTHDFLTTTYSLVANHHFTVHGKVTFLTPVLYVLAFFPKVPALIVIPLAQHLRGLLMVLMVGALARLWLRGWRWWIVPLMVLAGTQPAVLFWEHTLMSESGFVFCAVGLALAGTIFVRWPCRLTYGLLLAGMACVAAARPEGNLWQGAGVLVVLIVYWGRWRERWLRIAGAVALTAGMLSITKTSHSGLLLYSSMVHFSPDDSQVAPGFGPYIRATRDEYRTKRAEAVGDDVVKASRPIQAAILAYAVDHPKAKLGWSKGLFKAKKARKSAAGKGEAAAEVRRGNNLSDLCRRLATEAAREHPWELPGYAWRKFLARSHDDPGGEVEDYTFHYKQAFTLVGNPNISDTLGQALAGTPLDNLTEATDFVDAHYDLHKAEWYNMLDRAWLAGSNYFHLPRRPYSPKYALPGLTLLQLLAMLGAGVALLRPTRVQRFHWAFVPTLAGAGFLVMLTAAVIPRHRFVWEPFWLLYGFYFLDSVAAGILWLVHRARRPPPPPVPEGSAPAGASLPV